MYDFYEFFAGGGMARAGLGANWSCLFANDFDHKKSATYEQNWGKGLLKTCDVRTIKPEELPGQPNLIWASFPCQDLSLAGAGAGLKGDRSGTFWPFWEVVKGLVAQHRAPEMIMLENVCGTLTSHGGKDFAAICGALANADYKFGAMVIDAALFVPQSRPRLFILGVRGDLAIPEDVYSDEAVSPWCPKALASALDSLPVKARQKWIWWNMPKPKARQTIFADLIEDEPDSVSWQSAAETRQLLAMMSEINRKKVEQAKALAKKTGRRIVGAIYKRTRADEDGVKTQRAEIRFDDIAGCLRTPAGGSSRQLILVIDGSKVRSRLISSRETARLMGLPDTYVLPDNYNEAYHLTGDGIAVPVVRHIANNILEPLIVAQAAYSRAVV